LYKSHWGIFGSIGLKRTATTSAEQLHFNTLLI